MIQSIVISSFSSSSNEAYLLLINSSLAFFIFVTIDLLTLFVTEQGKILPRRATGVTIQQQRKLSKAIKRARILSLFPFVASNSV